MTERKDERFTGNCFGGDESTGCDESYGSHLRVGAQHCCRERVSELRVGHVSGLIGSDSCVRMSERVRAKTAESARRTCSVDSLVATGQVSMQAGSR
ncbi:hypothetical protein LSAT2_023528 [Lamellibrachia satsuma]|nr:hypothetical protein LSAT2_023528 [Lamellibrachia satsuma]